jgi:hypothetical protein
MRDWRNHGPSPKISHPQKITIGEMRASGVRSVLVYCSDKCSHGTAMNGDGWPDDVRLSDIKPMFACRVCDHRGADVRPCLDRIRARSAIDAIW